MESKLSFPCDDFTNTLWESISPNAQIAFSSAELILSIDKPLFDYGLVIIGYFKSIEINLADKVFTRFRTQISTNKEIKENNEALGETNSEFSQLYRIHNYVFEQKSLTLVDMVQILQYLKRVGDDKKFGLLWLLKKFISQHYPRGYWFWSTKKTLAIKLELLTLEYRNPAAHTAVCSKEEALDLRLKILGDRSREGILISIAKALT